MIFLQEHLHKFKTNLIELFFLFLQICYQKNRERNINMYKHDNNMQEKRQIIHKIY